MKDAILIQERRRAATCPDCGGVLEAEAIGPGTHSLGGDVEGVRVGIRCSSCETEFGPIVFVARVGPNVVYVTPPIDVLRGLSPQDPHEAAVVGGGA